MAQPGFEVGLTANVGELSKLNQRLGRFLSSVLDTKGLFKEIGEYMVRSTRHRIRQGDTDPAGRPLPALREVTRLLKGEEGQPDRPLYASGRLYRSIRLAELGGWGFVVDADPAIAPHAAATQDGVDRPAGRFRTPSGRVVYRRRPAPPRPFLGFSDENVRRISQMVRNHIIKEQGR